MLFEIMNA